MDAKGPPDPTPQRLAFIRQLGRGAAVAAVGITAAALVALVVVGLAYTLHEDSLVGRYYDQQFVAHPGQAPAEVASLAAIHLQSALGFTQAVLAIILGAATIAYAWIAHRARKDAMRATEVAAKLNEQVAVALERLAAAAESNHGTVTAADNRPLLVINLGRRGR